MFTCRCDLSEFIIVQVALFKVRSNTSSGTRIDGEGVVCSSCSIDSSESSRTVRRVLAVRPSELELLNCGRNSSNNSRSNWNYERALR